MKHFLATRFNVKIKGWEHTRDGERLLTDEWLEERLELFERFCWPSVRNQTNQRFLWCVFFDRETSPWAQKTIDLFSETYDNFRPIYVENNEGLVHSFKEFISRHMPAAGDDFLISTRLDTDDVIHEEFVDSIQHNFRPVDGLVIDPPVGFQITLGRSIDQIREYEEHFGHFISVVEARQDPRTVYSRMHMDWEDAEKIVKIEGKRLWGEIIHESNYVNRPKRYLSRSEVFSNRAFGLEKDVIRDSPIMARMNNLFLALRIGTPRSPSRTSR